MLGARILLVVAYTDRFILLINAQYAENFTTANMKIRLYKMDQELVKDCYVKLIATSPLKSFYEDTIGYQYGEMAHKIRLKYSRMLFLYSRSVLLYDKLSHFKDIDHLLEIQMLSKDIFNLVRIIKLWEDEDDYLYHPPKGGPKPPRKSKLRSREEKRKTELKAKHIWVSQTDDRKRQLDQSRHNVSDIASKVDIMEDGFDTDA